MFWHESPRSLLWGGYFWSEGPHPDVTNVRYYCCYERAGRVFDSVAPIREDGWYWFYCTKSDYRYSELHGPYPDPKMAMNNCDLTIGYADGVVSSYYNMP